jgi:hypothetical protein
MAPIRSSSRRGRPLLSLALLVLGLYAYYYHIRPLGSNAPIPFRPYGIAVPLQPVQPSSALVPLEAHIMSKCPDARDCLREMVLPAMQKVYDKVNFTLSFIGRYVILLVLNKGLASPSADTLSRPTENDGVACMHGPGECM